MPPLYMFIGAFAVSILLIAVFTVIDDCAYSNMLKQEDEEYANILKRQREMQNVN